MLQNIKPRNPSKSGTLQSHLQGYINDDFPAAAFELCRMSENWKCGVSEAVSEVTTRINVFLKAISGELLQSGRPKSVRLCYYPAASSTLIISYEFFHVYSKPHNNITKIEGSKQGNVKSVDE